eukprot:g2528.t1
MSSDQRQHFLDIFFEAFPDVKDAYNDAKAELDSQLESLKAAWEQLSKERREFKEEKKSFQAERVAAEEETRAIAAATEGSANEQRSNETDSSSANDMRFRRQELGLSLAQCQDSLNQIKEDKLSLESRFQAVNLRLKNHEKCCALSSESSAAIEQLKSELSAV